MATQVAGLNRDTNHGRALHAFLEEEWAAKGVTRGAWCRASGVSDSTVIRWGKGFQPELNSMRQVADYLGRSLLDILVIAGFLTPREAKGYTPVPPEPPSITDAIAHDPSMTRDEREAMRQMWDALGRIRNAGPRRRR